jgi:hypothetical protein
MQSGIFEAEDTRRDRKACVDAKQVAVAGHPSDGEGLKTSKTALEGNLDTKSLEMLSGKMTSLVEAIELHEEP